MNDDQCVAEPRALTPVGIGGEKPMSRQRYFELLDIARDVVTIAETKGVMRHEWCRFGDMCNHISRLE